MTDEEQILKSLEDLVNEAQEKIRKEQISHHQRSMPFFKSQAAKDTEGMESGGLHLFVLAEAETVPDGVTLENPLGLTDDDHYQNAVFHHFHRFDDTEQAVALMMDLKAAVVAHHAREGHQIGYFLVYDDSTCLLYAAAKLTIHKSVSPTESITFTADINRDEPEEFFAKAQVSDDIKRLAAAVMFFAEGGAEFKQNMPDTYDLMVKRILDDIGEGDE